MGDVVPSDWSPRLAAAIVNTIGEFAPTLGGSAVVLFAVDCHPWHGSIDLAALTISETITDPVLADPSEMAAWRHYCFSDQMAAWSPVAVLGREMRAAYETASHPSAMAEEFIRACARAAVSQEVASAVKLLGPTADFRVTVTHPDDGREFATDTAHNTETSSEGRTR